MAKRRKRRAARSSRSKSAPMPGWVWMIFGLGIGLAVAYAVYLREPKAVASRPQPVSAEPAPVARQAPPPALDDNGEAAAAEPEKRFDFYEMLPKFEVVIPETESDVTADSEPRAVEQPGTYVLQAGSFTRHEDADRRRAQLALQGIESTIQRITIDDRTYHRVRIGPISDLDELNVLRSRLRAANIDVLRIRLDEQ